MSTIEQKTKDTPELEQEKITKPNICNKLLRSILIKPTLLNRVNYDSCYTKHILLNLKLQTDNGNDVGVHVIRPDTITANTKFLIALHDKRSNRASFGRKLNVDSLVDRDMVVIIPDVGPFGDSNGQYDVNLINKDIERLFSYCFHGFGTRKISFLTHGIGAGMALAFYNNISRKEPLYYQIEVDKFILVAPVLSEEKLLKDSMAFSLVNKMARYNIKESCAELINDVEEHILTISVNRVIIIHGVKDKVVRFKDGLKLANVRGCKIYKSEDDDHDTILKNADVHDVIFEFLNEEERNTYQLRGKK